MRHFQETAAVPATGAGGATGAAGALAASTGNVVVDLAGWLAGRVSHREWRRLVSPPADPVAPPPRDAHLAHKYLARWRERVSNL